MKRLFYPFEALGFALIVLMGWLLPFRVGSALGGALGRLIGPRLTKVNAIAKRNFQLAQLPLTPTEQDDMVVKMWDNLGRTFLEYVRLPNQDPFDPNGVYDIEGIEHIDGLIHDGKPGLLFSAHLGNWELGTYVAQKRGLVTAQVTRFLNNPLTRFLVNGVHRRIARKVIPKGPEGAKLILKELKDGHHVSMLCDQKMNDGVAVPFLGHSAMTAPAVAKMALKLQCPIVPFQVIRLQGARCRIVYHPPLTMPTTGTPPEQALELLKQMNGLIESWIREHPAQWFWVHRRFAKEMYVP